MRRLLVALLTLVMACGPAAPPSPTAPPAAPTTPPTAAPKAPEAPKPTEAPKPAQAPKPTEALAKPTAAPAAAGSTPAPLSPPVKVLVADNQTTGAAPIHIALDRGYYKEEGLEVELIPLGTAQVVQSVAASQVAFALANPEPTLFNALDRGIEVRLVVPIARNQRGDKPAGFLVRQDLLDSSQYKSPKDLRGKKVGIPALQSQFYVDLFLKQEGMSPDDVEIVMLGLPEIVAAFASKSIDAAWNAEPANTLAEQQGVAKVVAGTGDLLPGGVGSALALRGGADGRPRRRLAPRR